LEVVESKLRTGDTRKDWLTISSPLAGQMIGAILRGGTIFVEGRSYNVGSAVE
jgi:hypothetical protein